MIGTPHNLPGVAIVMDMASPGERLEGNAHATLRGPVAKITEMSGRPVDAAEGIRRDVAADHQKIATELLHQIKFPLRPRESFRTIRLGHPFEIAERLQRHGSQAVILDHLANVNRRAGVGQEIVLEDLNALEARRSDSRNLLRERPAQTNGRNSGLHDRHPSGDAL